MELATKRPFEIEFGAGVPERNERENRGDVFIYPEEIIGKTCSECMRFTSNDDGYYHNGHKHFRCEKCGCSFME